MISPKASYRHNPYVPVLSESIIAYINTTYTEPLLRDLYLTNRSMNYKLEQVYCRVLKCNDPFDVLTVHTFVMTTLKKLHASRKGEEAIFDFPKRQSLIQSIFYDLIGRVSFSETAYIEILQDIHKLDIRPDEHLCQLALSKKEQYVRTRPNAEQNEVFKLYPSLLKSGLPFELTTASST